MKIILIDDHPVVRRGLRSILGSENGLEVCCEAEEGNEAIKLIGEHKPDLAIIDIELKGNINGMELVKAIKERYPKTIMLVMSIYDGTIYAERSIRAGAKGFIAKEEASENILNAIQTVMDGRLYLSNEISNTIASKHIYGSVENCDCDIDVLSNRELEIFKLIGHGYKRSEIARKLRININTIESHRRKIREKLNLKNSSELSKTAVRWNAHKSKNF